MLNNFKTYDPSELDNIEFKQYCYGFDSGYCTKVGLTYDNKIYIIKCWKFSDDKDLNKALDEYIIII